MQKFTFEDFDGSQLNFHQSDGKQVYFSTAEKIKGPCVLLDKKDVLEIIAALQKIVQDGGLD